MSRTEFSKKSIPEHSQRTIFDFDTQDSPQQIMKVEVDESLCSGCNKEITKGQSHINMPEIEGVRKRYHSICNPIESEKEVITIHVDAEWEIRDKSYGNVDASGREYEGLYKGGWTITKCKGHPQINGGMGTPDMMALFPNEQSIIDKFVDQYSEWYDGQYKIEVKLTVIKDDRPKPTQQIFDAPCPRCKVGNHKYCWKREGTDGCSCDCENGEWGKE